MTVGCPCIYTNTSFTRYSVYVKSHSQSLQSLSESLFCRRFNFKSRASTHEGSHGLKGMQHDVLRLP